MVMEVMEAMDMAVDTMARGRLKLSQDILEDMVVMVMDVDMEVMDMAVDTMARGKLKQSQDILEDMVVMVMDVDGAYGYGRGYYGKREADAEPGYLRGYGGYGRGYGYG